MKTLKRYTVGELPIIYSIAERINLRSILYEFIPKQGNEEIPVVEILLLLIYNIVRAKSPLYELPQWVGSLNLEVLGLDRYELQQFTDDRFGRALDKLFEIDRASLMTRIILEVIKTFNIQLNQIHNDSTTVKAFGDYPEKSSSGFEFKKGKSKDHRPDLKQLVYSLSISQDGAVPVHYKVYSGNVSDSSTHIETWNTLSKICKSRDFLYVADCKLCTDAQLSHIVNLGGKAITTIPENWTEINSFKECLRKEKKKRTEVWRKEIEHEDRVYYYAFDGDYYTKLRGYRIHWILSTDKKKEDEEKRERLLAKAEKELNSLLTKINKRNLKTKEAIQKKVDDILKKRKAGRILNVEVNTTIERSVKRKKQKDKVIEIETKKSIYTLFWERNKGKIKEEENLDGVFPLLSTDKNLSAKEVLMAFKYQPKLEKRFSQFKSVHNAAPIYFKRVERVEANMFLFFIGLVIQALIEREIRQKMIEDKIDYLNIYPENRESAHPTTDIVFDRFSDISTYKILEGSNAIEYYQDELSELHLSILKMLNLDRSKYWRNDKVMQEKRVIG